VLKFKILSHIFERGILFVIEFSVLNEFVYRKMILLKTLENSVLMSFFQTSKSLKLEDEFGDLQEAPKRTILQGCSSTAAIAFYKS